MHKTNRPLSRKVSTTSNSAIAVTQPRENVALCELHGVKNKPHRLTFALMYVSMLFIHVDIVYLGIALLLLKRGRLYDFM